MKKAKIKVTLRRLRRAIQADYRVERLVGAEFVSCEGCHGTPNSFRVDDTMNMSDAQALVGDDQLEVTFKSSHD